jgi:hypothetical protein
MPMHNILGRSVQVRKLHQRVDTILLPLQNPLFAIPICSSLERCTLNLYRHVNLVGQMLSAAALKQHLGHLRMLNLSAQSPSSTGYSPGSCCNPSPTHPSHDLLVKERSVEGVFVGWSRARVWILKNNLSPPDSVELILTLRMITYISVILEWHSNQGQEQD